MSRALEKYLDRVMIYANRNQEDTAKIRIELRDHLLKKIDELESQGLQREDAVFQSIEDHGHPRTIGYGLRKGFALLDVRTQGTARGFIAVGPKAVGIIAFGNIAVGLFAFGNISFGAIAFGALALAALFSCGGISLSPLGAALGLAALGQVAFGMIACGRLAVGLWIPWAIDHVSFLIGDNAFQFLRYCRNYIENVEVLIITSWLFLAFPILHGVMCGIKDKEYRRIQKADPKLIE